MNKVTLVFSSHRPETLEVSAPLMKEHDAVFLEEPPTPEFHQFFDGTLSIDDYLITLDVEYPAFARLSCHHLKQLHAQGKAIIQIEPFLEELSRIHTLNWPKRKTPAASFMSIFAKPQTIIGPENDGLCLLQRSWIKEISKNLIVRNSRKAMQLC